MKTYWSRISIQHLAEIQTNTLAYIKQTKEQYTSPFHIFKWQEFVDHVPEIQTAFDHLNMKVIQVCAYFMQHNQNARPHRDHTTIPIRVNVPILNTANTWTNFYQFNTPQDPVKIKQLPNGLQYLHYDEQDLELVDCCEIIEPTLIRPMEIHSVDFAANNPTPRITLTMVLDPCPYEYFTDITVEQQQYYRDLTRKELTNPWFKQFVRPEYWANNGQTQDMDSL
jgi:hypothetical protein